MFFPCQHLSRTTCQLPLHLFSGNKGTDSSQMSSLYLPDNMPQAFASASNPHNFLSLSLYRDFVKERGLSGRERSDLQHNSAQVVCGSRYDVQRRQESLTNLLHFPESHPPWTDNATQCSISIQFYFLYSCRCILFSFVLILAYMYVHACVCIPNSLF